MLSSLSMWEWIKLIGSIVLFLIPGLLFLSLLKIRFNFSIIHITLAFGLSLGLWIILLIWLQLLNISLSSWSVRIMFSVCLLILIGQSLFRRGETLIWLRTEINVSQILILAFSGALVIFYLYLFRNLVAGMGSDSMHHTLISSLIIKQGQIPKDYQQYAPVVTFSYHFGFHTLVAALSWLSGISTRLMVVISGALLMGMISLAGAALVYYLTKQFLPSLIGASIIGIIYVFPSYSLLWGRYTQLLGTTMLIIFILSLMFWDEEEKYKLNFLPVIIVLTMGFLFSHYRIFIAGGIFSLVYLFFRKNLINYSKQFLARWIAVPICAVLISSPWLIRLLMSRKNGFAFQGTPSGAGYYSLVRLGSLFAAEPQTWILLGLTLIAFLTGLCLKNRTVIVVLIWCCILFLWSIPGFIGRYLDPVTLMISSYVPIAILIGTLIFILSKVSLNKSRFWISNSILVILTGFGIISGLNRLIKIDYPKNCFVTLGDLEAAEWIKGNTDNDAVFMINTYQFPFNNSLVIGLDAGYWLPELTGRRSVIPPMNISIEKLILPNANRIGVLLSELDGDLDSSDAVYLLETAEVDYVYIGDNGGNIEVKSLLESARFEVTYHSNNIYIFRYLNGDLN